MVAVQIDAGHISLVENFQLGGEIVLKIGMLYGRNVVAADVEETGGGEVGIQGAVILQRLAEHLHGDEGNPRRDGVGKMAVQFQRFGGGQMGLKAIHAVVGVDGGDHAALTLVLLLEVLVQNVLEVVGGGGFSLGTGDADHIQLLGRLVVVQVGQPRQTQAHILHQNTGKIHLGIGRFRDIGNGTLFLGLSQIVSLEVRTLTVKQGAGNNFPGIVGNQIDHGVGIEAGQLPGQQPLFFQHGAVGSQII